MAQAYPIAGSTTYFVSEYMATVMERGRKFFSGLVFIVSEEAVAAVGREKALMVFPFFGPCLPACEAKGA